MGPDRNHIAKLASPQGLKGAPVTFWLHDSFRGSSLKWSGRINGVHSTPAPPLPNAPNKPCERVLCSVDWAEEDIHRNRAFLVKEGKSVELGPSSEIMLLGDICTLPRFLSMHESPDPNPPVPTACTDYDGLWGFKVSFNIFDTTWSGSVARSVAAASAPLSISVEWQGDGTIMDFASGSIVAIQPSLLPCMCTELLSKTQLQADQRLAQAIENSRREPVRVRSDRNWNRHRREQDDRQVRTL